MAESSRAVLGSALDCLKTLLAPARGRHSARRRRSTRVRRYAPVPTPVSEPTPEPASVPASPSPRPAPPVDDTALVRPFYLAHERDLAYASAHPARRLRARTTRPTADGPPVSTPAYTPKHAAPRVPAPRPVPDGDLLAPVPPRPGEFDELRDLTRAWLGMNRATSSGPRKTEPGSSAWVTSSVECGSWI
ncbi:hypothetical protein [Nocardiopsis sp. FIRDI 009]|uniref:hypothetical protein n=1 Tax=Nocardiopsis sp. FIRDI 009 TaxID=714197 RepID=UPI0018E52084|nr:hypothetical protein [Nocardiopsis sp. FIRDI 009]